MLIKLLNQFEGSLTQNLYIMNPVCTITIILQFRTFLTLDCNDNHKKWNIGRAIQLNYLRLFNGKNKWPQILRLYTFHAMREHFVITLQLRYREFIIAQLFDYFISICFAQWFFISGTIPTIPSSNNRCNNTEFEQSRLSLHLVPIAQYFSLGQLI